MTRAKENSTGESDEADSNHEGRRHPSHYQEEMNEFRGQAEVNYGDGNFFVVACLRERPMLKVAGRMETLKKAIDRCLELGADYDTEIRYGTEQHNKEVFLVMPGDTVNDAVYADARKNGWLSQCHTPYCGSTEHILWTPTLTTIPRPDASSYATSMQPPYNKRWGTKCIKIEVSQ